MNEYMLEKWNSVILKLSARSKTSDEFIDECNIDIALNDRSTSNIQGVMNREVAKIWYKIALCDSGVIHKANW